MLHFLCSIYVFITKTEAMDPYPIKLEPTLPVRPPFWRNIGAILRYPLQGAAITSIGAFALFSAVGILPWVGVVLLLILWTAAFRYAIEVLERTANGYADAPELGLDAGGDIGRRMLFLQLLFVLAEVFCARIDDAGLRWLIMIPLAFAQPAATLTLALARNLESALNPLVWLRIVSRLGAPYLVLVVAPLMLGLLQDQANGLIAHALPSVFAMMLTGLIAFYLLVLEFHLIGYLIYQYRERIDWTPQWMPPLLPSDRHAPFLAHIERLVADGDGVHAAVEFEPYLRGAMHATPAMHDRYRQLLTKLGDTPALLRHGDLRIGQLLAVHDHRQALALLRESLALDPAWRPAAPEHSAALSDAAERTGQAQIALLLLREFHVRHPKHPDAPLHALHAAQLLLDREGNAVAARALLQEVATRYPQHPLEPELQSRLAELDALSHKLADQR
jgi:hypothetical protein